MLDDTLDLAYLIEETLEPEQTLKTVLAGNYINGETVEKYTADLSKLLSQILPAAKKTLALTKPGTQMATDTGPDAQTADSKD